MNYDKEILRFLCLAGHSGLSVRKIALHVHGACSTFFEPLKVEDVHRDVAAWLQRNSKGANPLVCRVGKRGMYAINYSSAKARQLLFDFEISDKEDILAKPCEEEKINNQLQLEF